MPTITSQFKTLQNAVAATGNGNIMNLNNYTTLVFNVTGTFVATVTFQVSNDATNWLSLAVVAEGTSAGSTTATASGLYRANVSGYRYARATITWTSGTSITVEANASFNTVTSASGGGGTGTNANQVQGNVASGATDSGFPVKVGAVFNTTLPTLINGQRGDLQVNSRAALLVELYSGIAGEDITVGVLKVEQRFSATYISTATTTVVKSGSGFIHSILVQGGVAGTIIVYDNTAASGTIIASFDSTNALQSYLIDVVVTIGITIITSAATKLTISYR